MSRRLRGFPAAVRSSGDLPAGVREAVLSHQSDASIRQIITIPPHEYPVRRTAWFFELPFGWRITPERTLAFGKDTLTLIEVERGAVSRAMSIPLAALLDIHLYQVLLYSWVELVWEGQGGEQATRIEYNSVGTSLIWQGLTCIRETFPHCGFHDPSVSPGVDLAQFPLKFRNYLRHSLMSDEPLVVAVYQPALRPSTRRWQRFISPNRTVAVTERNVIVVGDDRHRFRRRDTADADYAVSRHFYPLAQLQRASVESGPDFDQLRLRFGIRHVRHDVALPLAPPYAQQLCDLLHTRLSLP